MWEAGALSNDTELWIEHPEAYSHSFFTPQWLYIDEELRKENERMCFYDRRFLVLWASSGEQITAEPVFCQNTGAEKPQQHCSSLFWSHLWRFESRTEMLFSRKELVFRLIHCKSSFLLDQIGLLYHVNIFNVKPIFFPILPGVFPFSCIDSISETRMSIITLTF